MVKFTQSFSHWLWKNHRDIYALVLLGHVELVTDEMTKNYLEWCKTEDGRQYLKGGSKYIENDSGNKALDEALAEEEEQKGEDDAQTT